MLPSKLTTVEAYCFSSCSSLKSVVIPEGVVSINDAAFFQTALAEITLPSTLKIVAPGAFHNCKLEKVVVPDGVTAIGDFAFSSDMLKYIVVPDSVTVLDSGSLYSGADRETYTIYCGSGSEAMAYAKEYGYKYRIDGKLPDGAEAGQTTPETTEETPAA